MKDKIEIQDTKFLFRNVRIQEQSQSPGAYVNVMHIYIISQGAVHQHSIVSTVAF